MTTPLITPKRRKREERNAAIFAEWQRLSADPANDKEGVRAVLMEKHGLCRSTVIDICNKMEKRYYGDDDSRAE